MQHFEVIRDLIESACPSIRYRINTEISGRSAAIPEILVLQEQILLDPLVKEVVGWQQPDGWLAWDFHGAKSLETGFRILFEKGLSRQHPVLARALLAMEEHPERIYRGIGCA